MGIEKSFPLECFPFLISFFVFLYNKVIAKLVLTYSSYYKVSKIYEVCSDVPPYMQIENEFTGTSHVKIVLEQ